MIYIRKEGEAVRQGFNFYPLRDAGSFGCQMLFWKLRIELRWSKRAKRVTFRAWLKQPIEATKGEFIYIPGYTEFLEKCARKRFGYRPWKGVEPDNKFESVLD